MGVFGVAVRVFMSVRMVVLVRVLLGAAAARADYKVVVQSSNPIDSISKDKLSDIFLKKVTRWENGRARPSPLAMLRIAELLRSMGQDGADLLKRYFDRQTGE